MPPGRAGSSSRSPGRPARPPPRPSNKLEKEFRAQGLERVAGVDEVGRGCLFGPVVAAAVILDPQRPIRGLDDSKRLAPGMRRRLSERIRERAIAVSLAAADSARIDRWNILQATRQAMLEAVKGLSPAPDALLVDAITIALDIPQLAVIRGDALSLAIAAASIIAKVERDQWMEQWDRLYPGYGLASNKGYGTAAHLEALRRRGPTPLHRFSFRPVAEAARFPPAPFPATVLPPALGDAPASDAPPLFPETAASPAASKGAPR